MSSETGTYPEALALFQKGKLDAAEACLEKLTPPAGGTVEAWQLRAQIALDQGRPGDGAEHMRAALDLLPADSPARAIALANQGVALVRDGQTEAAETVLREALQLDEALANAQGTLILCLRQTGQAEAAFEAANRFVAQDPSDAGRWGLLATCEAEVAGNHTIYARGIAAFHAGAFADAIRYLSHTAENFPENVRYAVDECAAATQFGRWFGKDDELPSLMTKFEERASTATLGVYRLFASAAHFRAGRTADADRELKRAQEAMEAAGNWADTRLPDPASQQRLADAQENPASPSASPDAGLAERDFALVARQTGRRHPFESATAIGLRVYETLLRGLLGEHPEIDAVTRIGITCATVEQRLATEFPNTSFTGISRFASLIERNQQHYAAANLQFQAGDLLERIESAPAVECGLLLHYGAFAHEMPETIRAIYRTARRKGYRYIAALEPAGLNRETLRYPAPGRGFPSFACVDDWFCHDHGHMMIQAWYTLVHTHYYPMACALSSLAHADLHLIYTLAEKAPGEAPE